MRKKRIDLPRIDLIPLIDTLFCILFFYMTFAVFSPAVKHVSVPAKKNSKQNAETPAGKTVHVWVRESGHIFVDGKELQKEELFSFFRQNNKQISFVSVGGEDDVRVGEILRVIGWLKGTGVSNIGFRAR